MGGGSSGLGPILGTVVSGLSNGTASCFIKSLLLARKTVCCVGSGPILLRAIPSQSFELTSNQERTGLVFSRWSSTFSFSLFSGGSLSCCTVHILAAPDARESSSRLQLESTSPALLPLSLSSFLSPPPEPRPCLPGLPSPQPRGRHPERREAQTWPEAIYRVGVGRGGKPTALCIFGVWKLDRMPPFPRKPSFAGFQK